MRSIIFELQWSHPIFEPFLVFLDWNDRWVKGGDVGGTWYWNKYPGAGCDVPSHLYSFSWRMKADWSKAYSLGDEIQNYLVDCWKYARLENHTKFNTEVTKAVWDKNQNKWSLTLKTGNKEEIVFYNWFIRSAIFNHNLRMLKCGI